MPTYAYKCGTCNHQFEVFARMSDPDPETCEACGAATLEKVLFPVAVHYKGSGFYSTDYSGSKSSSGSGSGETKSSDSTPATGSGTDSSSSSGGSSSSEGSSSSSTSSD